MSDSIETIARLQEDLGRLGLRRGGTLLVHASLRSLGAVPGGAETVVQGLLRALGEGGTLLMPALSYASVDARNPVFDVRHTPSCVGALPEYFRTRPETHRSVHPTHSVSGLGAGVDKLLQDHHLDTTPCGSHSPFRRLRDVQGQILFLGCGMRPNTSMHAVEELVEPPYLFGDPISYEVRLTSGEQITMKVRRHQFGTWRQRYDRLESLLREGGMTRGKLLDATVELVNCEPMWEHALAALSKDPFFFVERTS